MKKIIFIFCMIISIIFISCEDDKVEKKIDKVTDKIEKSMDKAEKNMEKAGEKAEKALDKAGEKIENFFDWFINILLWKIKKGLSFSWTQAFYY